MSSMDNLKNAFAGESQANRKYLAFAKRLKRKVLNRLQVSSVQRQRPKQCTRTTICG